MIIVTTNEFMNFIKSQPDDRKLNFDEFTRYDTCGCPMIHYAREILQENNLSANECEWYGRTSDNREYGTHVKFEDGFSLASFFPRDCQLITTYGELKKSIIERYPTFNWSE